jgi:hypothetical protein
MRKLLSGLCASSLALSFAVASVAPVNAATFFVPQTIEQTSDVQNVQFRLRGDRYDGRRVIRRGDSFYLNGHRGIRYHRPGYRRYGDFWFPAAAFLVGALITGAIVDGSRSGSAHVQWCYDRYRSYRAWDNTFQPYDGPRRQCYSPYD